MNIIQENEDILSTHLNPTLNSILSSHLNCPICYEPLLLNSVFTSDGYPVHQTCITEYFANTNYPKSTTTNEPLIHTYTTPNIIHTKLIKYIIQNTPLYDTHIQNLTEIDPPLMDLIMTTNRLRSLFTSDALQNHKIKYLFSLIERKNESKLLETLSTEPTEPTEPTESTEPTKPINLTTQTNDTNDTLLTYAIKHKLSMKTILKLLISSDINHQNNSKHTPLLLAIIHDYTDVALTLLQQPNINLDLTDDTLKTPLIWAAKKGATQILDALLKHTTINHTINAIDNLGCTALMYLCEMHNPITQTLLQFPNLLINQQDHKGCTALIKACYFSLSEVALKLIEFPDLNYNHLDHTSSSALAWACEAKLNKVALKLLELPNIQVNTIDSSSCTPLMWACESKLNQVALKILDFNVPHYLDQSDTFGHTALLKACCFKLSDVALKILDHPLNINHVDNTSSSALAWACERKLSNVALKILDLSGINIQTVDSSSCTPLMWACEKGLMDVALRLLEMMPTNINQKDTYNNTALMKACCSNLSSVVLKFLTIDGIDIDCQNNNDCSAITFALQNDIDDEVIRKLIYR